MSNVECWIIPLFFKRKAWQKNFSVLNVTVNQKDVLAICLTFLFTKEQKKKIRFISLYFSFFRFLKILLFFLLTSPVKPTTCHPLQRRGLVIDWRQSRLINREKLQKKMPFSCKELRLCVCLCKPRYISALKQLRFYPGSSCQMLWGTRTSHWHTAQYFFQIHSPTAWSGKG